MLTEIWSAQASQIHYKETLWIHFLYNYIILKGLEKKNLRISLQFGYLPIPTH